MSKHVSYNVDVSNNLSCIYWEHSSFLIVLESHPPRRSIHMDMVELEFLSTPRAYIPIITPGHGWCYWSLLPILFSIVGFRHFTIVRYLSHVHLGWMCEFQIPCNSNYKLSKKLIVPSPGWANQIDFPRTLQNVNNLVDIACRMSRACRCVNRNQLVIHIHFITTWRYIYPS